MSNEELEAHFARKNRWARWGGRVWRAWAMNWPGPLSPLALLVPETHPLPRQWRPDAFLEDILEATPAVFETPRFGELAGVAGDVDWNDHGRDERLVLSGGRVFDLALLARGMSIVEPRDGAVAFDVIEDTRSCPAVMRVHASTWVLLLASTLHLRAPELVFDRGEVRRVA